MTVSPDAEVEGLSTGEDDEPADGSITEEKLDKALSDKLNDFETRLAALETSSSSGNEDEPSSDS
ncbi:hypothetical protein [Carnimonas bestiolae]|uniref:hypothetical protein n=1 Tax=Carnimonas bestiolae TaxID=3402172 RepID=UPI003F4ABB87